MNIQRRAIRGIVATPLLGIGVVLGGFPTAAAQPDYGTWPVDPNVITDSTAYTAAAPVMNPDGQTGVTAVYTHRDGSRQITNTILVFADPAAATAASNGSDISEFVVGGNEQPATVGANGKITTGSSPDGSQSVSVLEFTEGNAAATIAFEGPPNDPVPVELVTEYGQRQDGAIKGASSE